ncbi:MAG: hypothetical protein PHE18_08135 [Candidatus Omnitrophica bacterium]|nr:hypothetical protein [Candidatus Omnitrophota bacterium]MDD5553821.1 hypothetical protein [Candidatus Omnitrophota bacterium]
MRKIRIKSAPVIRSKMAGFLFSCFLRNKRSCNYLTYIILVLFVFLSVCTACALTVSSPNYSMGVISFMQGGGASSGVSKANWTAVGEGIASLQQLRAAGYSTLLAGQLYLFASPEEGMNWIISNIQAKTDILGFIIPESEWQKDNDPYFYWDVDVSPPENIDGYSVSLDNLPELEINTDEPAYQFSPDSISSGKHIFYVLPYTPARGWEQQNLLSFQIWVDIDPPVAGSIQPQSGALITDNLIPITCSLYDSDSGMDEASTVLTINNQPASFEYDEETRLLTHQPASAYAEGDNAVMLKAVDAVGNFVVNGWNFIVDTLAPEGSVLINGGQEITRSPYVTINIEAIDATSGVKNIYLSNDGIFDTELNNPYPYSPSISDWLLREPEVSGVKYVYAKFEDFAGNISPTYKDEISLELITPSTRIISGPPTVTEETAADFLYESSREGSKFKYKIDNLEWSGWVEQNTAHFDGLAEGNHYFYVKSGFDSNGDGEITADEEDPTPAQWSWSIRPKGYFEKLRERILFWRR